MASTNNNKPIVRIGSRKSQLALIQTNIVLEELKKYHPSRQFEIVTMSTKGDEILDKPLAEIGGKALFTKELEIALCNKDVDLVVHSLKDLPTNLDNNCNDGFVELVIGAICKREDPRDAVVLHPKYRDKGKLGNLPSGSIVGTSSVRRNAQLKKNFPNLSFKNLRGNLNTRFRKLEENDEYDAIILANAGIMRMGWEEKISQLLSPNECMHAIGQGALAVECRADDEEILDLISVLRHLPTTLCCLAERAFMNTLEGGCSVPLAATSSYEDGKLTLKGAVFSCDGCEEIIDEVSIKFETDNNNQNGSPPKKMKVMTDENKNYVGVYNGDLKSSHKLRLAQELGIKLANKLKDMGADEVLKRVKRDNDK